MTINKMMLVLDRAGVLRQWSPVVSFNQLLLSPWGPAEILLFSLFLFRGISAILIIPFDVSRSKTIDNLGEILFCVFSLGWGLIKRRMKFQWHD